MMRIVWGLHDSERAEGDTLVALFEAENLLDGYRDYCLRNWYDELTQPNDRDILPGEGYDDGQPDSRSVLLDKGYDSFRSEQVYGPYPRFTKKKYELWNSVPPNVERLIVHYDT